MNGLFNIYIYHSFISLYKTAYNVLFFVNIKQNEKCLFLQTDNPSCSGLVFGCGPVFIYCLMLFCWVHYVAKKNICTFQSPNVFQI